MKKLARLTKYKNKLKKKKTFFSIEILFFSKSNLKIYRIYEYLAILILLF